MDRDPRIMRLALYAAKSYHQIQGLQYDESILIDMFNDVKMSVVEMKLPLGCKSVCRVDAFNYYYFVLALHMILSFSVIFVENEGKWAFRLYSHYVESISHRI